MGIIISRFRKKKSTFEKLEELDQDIRSIEKFRYNTEQAQKKIVGQFIVISAAVYIIVAFVFYFYFFPATFYEQLFYITPLLLVPFIILFVKRLLTWYYKRKISRNESKLSVLRVEKKKLLDRVMDTETYKVAKNILEKFAPDQLRKSPTFEIGSYKPTGTQSIDRPSSPSTPVIRSRALLASTRTPAITSAKMSALKGSSLTHLMSSTPSQVTNGQNTASQNIGGMSSRPSEPRPTPLPMARAILPRERSVLDKMVEYLVGDGPSNRYALICKNCQSHNGMALREEFEYIAFRCCYCYFYNPARKLRPSAPVLQDKSPLRKPLLSEKSSSESEKNSGTDSDSEKEQKPIESLDVSNASAEEEEEENESASKKND